jgi:hypothetical protein
MRIRLGFFLTLFFIIHSSAAAIDRIRIAVSNPNMPKLTLAVAQKRGFLKDEGIEAEVIRMNPNVSITALASGDIDYSQLFGAVVGAAAPRDRGRHPIRARRFDEPQGTSGRRGGFHRQPDHRRVDYFRFLQMIRAPAPRRPTSEMGASEVSRFLSALAVDGTAG